MRRGDKVRVLPSRGTSHAADQRLWRVTRIERADGQRRAHLTELGAEESETQFALADDLVVVAEFNDRIYPGLIETGRVERGGPDKPFHTVINAENYHALEMLTYTHRHSVDAIYIDPRTTPARRTGSTTTTTSKATTTTATQNGWRSWNDD